MGLYFRKSKSVGPVRFNFSKSGIGVSTGVKGARISTGPRGTYINLGRNGIYYRKKIGGSSSNKTGSSKRKQSSAPAYSPDYLEVEEDAIRIAPGSEYESSIGDSIKKVVKRIWIETCVAVLVCVAIALCFPSEDVLILLVPFLGLCIAVPQLHKTHINYSLDREASLEWEKFSEILCLLCSSKKVWIIETEKRNADTKYHAGATRNISRGTATIRRIKPKRATDFHIKTNVELISLRSKKCSLLFLPSDVVIKKGHKYTSYSYEQLSILASTTFFIERERVPRDAEISRYTWQYVNKDGSADRRFSHNRQLPVCMYGLLKLFVGDEMSVEIHTSNKAVVYNIGQAYRHYCAYIASLKSVHPKTGTSSLTSATDAGIRDSICELNASAHDTGRDLAASFSDWLSCNVHFIDGQIQSGIAILFYKSSKDVSASLPLLSKTLNDQLQYEVEIKPVSENAFLVYVYLTTDQDLSSYDVPLSSLLREAIEKSKQWAVTHNRFAPPSRTEAPERVVDPQESAAKGVDLFDDEDGVCPPTSEPDNYSDLFEDDGGKDDHQSSDDLIDELLKFLDEE